ncbi:MAG: hypothetical protein GY751_07105, partial [Bacteroidetes bacterium]|nr:hypothetical protein [Bacteroidota bacterium]
GTLRSGYMIPAGEWHHYAVTIDNESRTVDFYVDGEKIGNTHSYNNQFSANMRDVYIGQYGGGYRWDGRIDNVKIFGQALTIEEIREVYNEDVDIVNVPNSPTQLSGVVGEGSITLNWTDNAYNENGYIVQRSADGADFETIADLSMDAIQYTDGNLSMEGVYTYRVYAYNDVGSSNFVETQIVTQDSPSRLFAHYKLENNGSDSSGNGLNGTVAGELNFVAGINGQAGDFDALVNNYINIDTAESYDVAQFSVSAWLQSDSGTRICAYINAPENFHIRTNNGIWDIVLDSAGTTVNSGYSFIPGEWHHHVVTIDNVSQTVDFYVDGVKFGESHPLPNTMSNQTIDFNAYIGQFNSSYRWDGRIDEVRFYEGKLTEQEVNDIYEAENPENQGDQANLFAHYKLDNNGNDSSGNGLNGTVEGDLGFVTGINGQAGDFDAVVNNYINIDTTESYDVAQFSVSAWLQSDSGTRICA